jgi:hypothetical protein
MNELLFLSMKYSGINRNNELFNEHKSALRLRGTVVRASGAMI